MTIELNSLRKEFDVGGGTEVAVDGVDLQIREQEFVTLVGPSGCGKTTLLRCIAGLETPTSGDIIINGEEVTDIPANKRNLAMMFQNIALYPHMTIRENIAYPLKVKKYKEEYRHEQAEEAADIMQIPNMLDKYPAELSGGQRQRAALARTIIQEPNAFLMDEPLSDLDAQLKVDIRKEIQKVHRRVKKPTLYVTHDQEEAMTMSDRIAVMNDGNIQQIGTPDELYTQPNSVFVGQFIGSPSMNFREVTIHEIRDGHISLELQSNRFEFDIFGDDINTLDSKAVIGFRPETISLNRESAMDGLSGTVSLLERIGDRYLATVTNEGEDILATVQPDADLNEGDEVALDIDWQHVHLFDPRTGEIAARATGFQKRHQDPPKSD